MHQRTLGPAPARPLLWATMLGVGMAWGATTPLSKIAMAGDIHPIGATIWQCLILSVVLSAVLVVQGRRLPLGRAYIGFYLLLGLLGTALPHPMGYLAARHLPSSVLSVILAGIPMVTLVVASLAGIDRPSPRRVLGLLCGFAAIVVLVAPAGSLPSGAAWLWVLLPIASTLSYALENVCIDKLRLPQLDPLSTLCGLSWGAFVLSAPLALLPGVAVAPWPLDTGRWALLAITLLHMGAYFGLIWMIGKAGAVFATQVSYVVTLSGITFAIVFLNEPATPALALAIALMVLGLSLVRPRTAPNERPSTA
ncbi:MAG: DMT family transporter [Rhodobacteraceae bacterium]|nr:DMT family transporter [Paracoccaceae bacterium]